MKPEPSYPLDELTSRHAALRMARMADEAIKAGAPVTRVTPGMIAEMSRKTNGPAVSPDVRARASRAGGIARAEMLRAQRRLRAEECK